MVRADYRAIPLPLLREYLRDAAELSSERQVADAIGIGRTTLKMFINASTSPHPRVKRRIALWYLEQRALEDERQQLLRAEAALNQFVRGLPESSRDRAKGAIAAYVLDLYSILAVSAPPELKQIVNAESQDHSGATKDPADERDLR